MPAPSPEFTSAPAAPRWSRLRRAVSALRTMSWLASPVRVATNATPHASCSKRGSYSPWAGGPAGKARIDRCSRRRCRGRGGGRAGRAGKEAGDGVGPSAVRLASGVPRPGVLLAQRTGGGLPSGYPARRGSLHFSGVATPEKCQETVRRGADVAGGTRHRGRQRSSGPRSWSDAPASDTKIQVSPSCRSIRRKAGPRSRCGASRPRGPPRRRWATRPGPAAGGPCRGGGRGGGSGTRRLSCRPQSHAGADRPSPSTRRGQSFVRARLGVAGR